MLELNLIWPEKVYIIALPPSNAENDDGFGETHQPPKWMFEGSESGIFNDIPWYLDELVPQGFLGRNFVQSRGPSLNIGPDPARWTFAERIVAMLYYGQDVPGAYLLGTAIRDRFGERDSFELERDCLGPENLPETYETLAAEGLAGKQAGSSAGGEQPKFTTFRTLKEADKGEWVIVKFSGSLESSVGRRWSDLLCAESIALSLLARHGVPSANCRIVNGSKRVFLESTRFDRVGLWGRRAMISLRPLVAAFDGGLDENWIDVAPRLEDLRWITPLAAQTLAKAYWFGVLIGNTDMHFGNASVFLTDERPFELCPIYDMLPMRYRPLPSGDMFNGSLDHAGEKKLLPGRQDVHLWLEVSNWAIKFWQETEDHQEISPEFQTIASTNRQLIQRLQKAMKKRRGL